MIIREKLGVSTRSDDDILLNLVGKLKLFFSSYFPINRTNKWLNATTKSFLLCRSWFSRIHLNLICILAMLSCYVSEITNIYILRRPKGLRGVQGRCSLHYNTSSCVRSLNVVNCKSSFLDFSFWMAWQDHPTPFCSF